MIPKLKDYAKYVGKETIEDIRDQSYKLAVSDVHLTHINSTSSGGGVAEILNTHVILMNELGIETGWRLLKGTHSFFTVTKQFLNALQGTPMELTKEKHEVYLEEIERNSLMNHLKHHDMIVVHDPQPLAIVQQYYKKQPWIWRCHVDMSTPHPQTWKYLKEYIKKYDRVIVSMNKYKRKRLGMPQVVIPPAIDPLSLKNKPMSDAKCRKIMSQNGLDPEVPMICQVSRFDKCKNPIGAVNIFRRVKKKVKDCRLVLIGDASVDDPESSEMYNELTEYVKDDKDVHIISKKSDELVNALQRKSDVILQNSRKEGFGLTVTEALWKETAVVATNVGGIPLQVKNRKTGFLVSSERQAAKRCVELLKDRKLAAKLGKHGKELVRKEFLITTHLQSYLELCNDVMFNRKR
ncbi:glycosyltransferase [Candidatus Woesearchaeota archaeon]|nr:glycosyltransferase [Candidatus Woesearchaeota archaeon]